MTARGDRFAPIRLLAPVVHELGRYPNLRFRLEQWAPYLRRDHGIEVEFLPYESPGRRFDGAIVVHEASTIGGAWFERHLSSHGIPFIYDFDDPLWVTSMEFGDWVTRLWRGPGKFEEITRLASHGGKHAGAPASMATSIFATLYPSAASVTRIVNVKGADVFVYVNFRALPLFVAFTDHS